MSRPVIDVLNDSAVDAVRKSGLAVETARMATVTGLNADGTLDVQAGPDSFPRVRVLSAYLNPDTGDVVEIMNTAGGWVCLGQLMVSTQPRIQRGTASVPAVSGTTANPALWGQVDVTFPRPFASVPTVVVSAAENIGANGTDLAVSAQAPTTTGVRIRGRRGAPGGSVSFSGLTVSWIATDL
ncbi:hypothetical protein E0L36_26655 [Streptomyces sp. AJS327]|uniref:H-type lectin domain-containing protein n=1 Tax=Streptomyces sp. AJS327 TaxID=2545265 RepID=UPI0015DE3BD1|nr:H-type lectin domain-containing protein [Streptomyces sp. AJS327]MBA0054302.1 hypothetical protein [Streptomyces sp. AJS327]